MDCVSPTPPPSPYVALSQSRAECGVELALSWDSTGPWLLDACPCLPSEQFSQGLVCLLRTERARPFPLSVPPGNLVGPAAAGLPGVAFQAPPGSQASSRGEAKDSALLSSRDAGLLEPPERPEL